MLPSNGPCYSKSLRVPDGDTSNHLCDYVPLKHLKKTSYLYLLIYTLRRPVMGEVLSTRNWGVPLAYLGSR